MLSVLVLEFFVCWMPLYVLHTWAVFDAESAYSHVSASGIAAVHLLAYVSSCCNPITYCFMHDKYRQAFRNVLGCARKRRWSSTKSHDKFASTNSVCSASRNANGKTPAFVGVFSASPHGGPRFPLNDVTQVPHSRCRDPGGGTAA